MAPLKKQKQAEVPHMPIREVDRDKAALGSCREDALWQNLQRKFVTVPLIYICVCGQMARPYGPDAGHRNTKPESTPNLRTVPRITRAQF
jgi:hypothetical protein